MQTHSVGHQKTIMKDQEWLAKVLCQSYSFLELLTSEQTFEGKEVYWDDDAGCIGEEVMARSIWSIFVSIPISKVTSDLELKTFHESNFTTMLKLLFVLSTSFRYMISCNVTYKYNLSLYFYYMAFYSYTTWRCIEQQ